MLKRISSIIVVSVLTAAVLACGFGRSLSPPSALEASGVSPGLSIEELLLFQGSSCSEFGDGEARCFLRDGTFAPGVESIDVYYEDHIPWRYEIEYTSEVAEETDWEKAVEEARKRWGQETAAFTVPQAYSLDESQRAYEPYLNNDGWDAAPRGECALWRDGDRGVLMCRSRAIFFYERKPMDAGYFELEVLYVDVSGLPGHSPLDPDSERSKPKGGFTP